MYLSNTPIRVIDVFAGVGGLSYGFARNSRFEIVAANELLAPMAKAYSINHPQVKMYPGDIKDFSAADVESDLGIRRSNIDVVIGAPPCQSFSTLGKRLLDDPRGLLFREYYRLLQEFTPRLFLFENVRGLLSLRGGELFETILAIFKSLGYAVSWRLLNAADFGVPQRRERVIIVGTLDGREFVFPTPTHFDPAKPPAEIGCIEPYVTVAEAIGDLPLDGAGKPFMYYACQAQSKYQRRMRGEKACGLRDHVARRNKPELVGLMECLADGGRARDLAALPLWFANVRSFANTYSRLWWQRPCTTITRSFGSPSGSRCIHPIAPRALTIREAARIQSFPDHFRFVGSKSAKCLQIGNAVPPLLAEAIAIAVAEHLAAGAPYLEPDG